MEEYRVFLLHLNYWSLTPTPSGLRGGVRERLHIHSSPLHGHEQTDPSCFMKSITIKCYTEILPVRDDFLLCQNKTQFFELFHKKKKRPLFYLPLGKREACCGFKNPCEITLLLLKCTVPRKVCCKEYYTFSVKNSHVAELKGQGRRDTSPLLREEQSVCMCV